MKITLNVDDDYLANVLCSGYEGGLMRQWCSKVHIEIGPATEDRARGDRLKERYLAPLLDGYWIITEIENGKSYRMDREAINRGVQAILDCYPHHLGAALGDGSMQDAVTGNLLIQCAIFGNERYA